MAAISEVSLWKKVLATASAGVFSLNTLGGAYLPRQTVEDQAPQALSGEIFKNNPPSLEIRDFIERQKGRYLTFGEAQGLVITVASLFASYGSRLTPAEIENSTYILRPENYFDVKHVTEGSVSDGLYYYLRLKEDYPNAEVDPLRLRISMLSPILGYNEKGKVVLFLGKMGHGYKAYKYDSTESNEVCEEATQAAEFITVAIHELVHQDIESVQEEVPVNQVLLSAYQEFASPPNPATKGVKTGFIMKFIPESAAPEETAVYTGLEEWITQYLASKILLGNNIPAVSIYGSGPKNIANFDAILNQAGISYEELMLMHRQSQVEDFLIRIADGAKGVSFEGDTQKISFSLERFSGLFGPWFRGFDRGWEAKFLPYYPEIDAQFYHDNPPFDERPPSCISPTILRRIL